MTRPPVIITLTTDFGTADAFVGVMKGVILGIAPGARLVDVTHAVPPQGILAGAYALAGAVPWFPPGTIHVAVVDPGVGTRRHALLVETRRGFLIGPDNGLLSLAAAQAGVRALWDVSRSAVRLRPLSRTFHGRDVFAPVAAHLAAGTPPAHLGHPLRSMIRLRPRRPRRRARTLVGEVLWIDHFGNAITNLTAADLAGVGFRRRGLSVRIQGHVFPIRASYGSVRPGKMLALVNSFGLLEVAMSHGSAAAAFALEAGTPVSVEKH